jgi:hypothetical protein
VSGRRLWRMPSSHRDQSSQVAGMAQPDDAPDEVQPSGRQDQEHGQYCERKQQPDQLGYNQSHDQTNKERHNVFVQYAHGSPSAVAGDGPSLTALPDAPKKADVPSRPGAFGHVGLLLNGPPGSSGLPFISSSDNSSRSLSMLEAKTARSNNVVRILCDDMQKAGIDRNMLATEVPDRMIHLLWSASESCTGWLRYVEKISRRKTRQ